MKVSQMNINGNLQQNKHLTKGTSGSTLICFTGDTSSVPMFSVDGLFRGLIKGLVGVLWGFCPNFLARSFSFLACANNTVCFCLYKKK